MRHHRYCIGGIGSLFACILLAGCASSGGKGGQLHQANRYSVEIQIKHANEVIGHRRVEVPVGGDGSDTWGEYLIGVSVRNRTAGVVDVNLRFFMNSEEGYLPLADTTVSTYPGQPGYSLEGTRFGSVEFGAIPWPIQRES